MTPDPVVDGAVGDNLPVQTGQPEAPGGPPVIRGSFTSKAMGGTETKWAFVRPNGVSGVIPVVLVLHGLNTDESTIFARDMNIQGALQTYVDAGNPPFAIAVASAGNNYYHRRTDGTDASAMILDEFVPMLAADERLAVRTDRMGLFGWSMGGYGALRLGALVGAPRITAIAVSSPALWVDPGNYPPRAFDSMDDYRANSLIGQQAAFAKIPLMISIGSSDQFYTYTRQWAAELSPPAAFGTAPGGHTNKFWRETLPSQIEFLGRSFTDLPPMTN